MAIVRSIGVKVSADVAGLESGLNKASTRIKKFETEVAGLGKGLGKVFGESGTIGLLGKGLAGAGIAAGIGIIADVVKRVAEESTGIVDQFRAGKIGAVEMASGIAVNIPLVNKLNGAMLAVNELFDDTSRRALKLSESYTRVGAIADRLQETTEQIALLKAPEALRPRLELDFKMRDELAKVDKLRAAATTDLERGAADRLAQRTRELFALQAAQLESPFKGVIENVRKGFASLWSGVAKQAAAAAAASKREWQDWTTYLESAAETVRNAIRTPAEQFSIDLGKARQAFVAGLLSSSQLETYTAKLRSDLLPATAPSRASGGLGGAGQFREIDLSRTFVPGLGSMQGRSNRPQKVEDERLNETNRILREMARTMSGGITAVA